MKIILSLLMAVMFLGSQAAAYDPDICDGQVGAAFGLCEAYIAMGCHTTDPDASEEACAKVEANYIKITGSTPPWANQCPLWSQEELDLIYENCYEWAVNDDCYREGLTSICADVASGPDPARESSIRFIHNPSTDLWLVTIRAYDPHRHIDIDRCSETTEDEWHDCATEVLSREFIECP